MEYFFTPGERIELHPATDMWMRGARFGDVIKELPATVTRPARVRVKLDKWPRPLTFRKDLVNPIDPTPGQVEPKGLSGEP